MAERVYTQSFNAAAAIIEKDGMVLLVKEGSPRLGSDQGKWNQPGGWIDVGEDPTQAVKREVAEETGLKFEPTGILGVYSLVRKDREKELGATPHVLKLLFRGKITGGELIQSSREIAELKWFTPEEIDKLENLRDRDIKQAVRDYFAGISYPLEIIHHRVQT